MCGRIVYHSLHTYEFVVADQCPVSSNRACVLDGRSEINAACGRARIKINRCQNTSKFVFIHYIYGAMPTFYAMPSYATTSTRRYTHTQLPSEQMSRPQSCRRLSAERINGNFSFDFDVVVVVVVIVEIIIVILHVVNCCELSLVLLFSPGWATSLLAQHTTAFLKTGGGLHFSLGIKVLEFG